MRSNSSSVIATGTLLRDQTSLSIHSEAHAWHHPGPALRLLTAESYRLGETEPLLESALVCAAAVLVDQTANPHPSLPPRWQPGQEDGVLDDDALLVTEAVRHPVLELFACQFAAVHPLVKGVAVVIAGIEHLPDLGFELVA